MTTTEHEPTTVKVHMPIVETITKRGVVYVNMDDLLSFLLETARVVRQETNRDALLIEEIASGLRQLRDERR